MDTGARNNFVVDYYDPQAGITRTYQLSYFLDDGTIEMYDLKSKRLFLKRCAYPSLSAKELYVGATVNVFSRPLRVVDYGDDATRKRLGSNASDCVLLLDMNRGQAVAGKVVDALTAAEIRITAARLAEISSGAASRAGCGQQRCLVLSAEGAKLTEKVSSVLTAFPEVLFQVTDATDAEEMQQVVRGPGKTTATMKNCAVCVVKPHAVTSGFHGPILQRLIDEGFYLSAIGTYQLSVADAEDFLEVYNGVVPEYKKLVEQMSSGVSWAFEVCAENPVPALRMVCGPHDPEVCHVLFPHTIRAKYGVDRVRNAVHCTDLEEDGPLESEFFFSLMQNKQ